jgi:excisionase family DNA binding protein
MNNRKTLSPREAANRLGISLNAIYSLLWAGKLNAQQRQNRWHISTTAVDKRLATRKSVQPFSEKQLGGK